MTAIHNYGTIERQAKIADDYARARSWQVRDVPPASAVEYAERIQELLSDFQNAVAVPRRCWRPDRRGQDHA